MSPTKKSRKTGTSKRRAAVMRVGKVAKRAAAAGMKAGARAGAPAAIKAGASEARKSWKTASPADKKRAKKRVAAVLAGAAALGAGVAGMAIARARRK
jgi:hypothetical protein